MSDLPAVIDPLDDPAEVIARMRRSPTYSETEARAAEMRVLGWSYPEIAADLGVVDARVVAAIVHEGTRALLREEAEDMRRLDLLRMDRMTRALMPLAAPGPEHGEEPNIAAVEAVLKISAQRAKLMGLNAPDKIQINAVEDGAAKRVDDVVRFTALLDGMVRAGEVVDANPPTGEDE